MKDQKETRSFLFGYRVIFRQFRIIQDLVSCFHYLCVKVLKLLTLIKLVGPVFRSLSQSDNIYEEVGNIEEENNPESSTSFEEPPLKKNSKRILNGEIFIQMIKSNK